MILVGGKATPSGICKVWEYPIYLICKCSFKCFRQLNLPNCIIGVIEEIKHYAPRVETADIFFFLNAFKYTFYVVKGE